MNILAAFFLIGLSITGLRVLARRLRVSLRPFNNTGAFLIQSSETENINLLSVTSNETMRRDSSFIRITSTRGANDRMKRLVVRRERADPEIAHASVGSVA